MKRAMITNARTVVALCDSTKMGSDYLVSFASLDDIDVVITDTGAPQSFVDAMRERSINVIIADA